MVCYKAVKQNCMQYTINSAYNKKNVEIFLHYRWLLIKGDVIVGEWEIFGVDVFLCYSQFFIKGDFVIGGVECILFYCFSKNFGLVHIAHYLNTSLGSGGPQD